MTMRANRPVRGYTAEYDDGRPADGPLTAIGAIYRAFVALEAARAEAVILRERIPASSAARILVDNVADPLMAHDWRALGMAVMADLAMDRTPRAVCLPGPRTWRRGGRPWQSR